MSVNEIQLANRFLELSPDSRRDFLNKLQRHELNFLELPIVETRHLYADSIPLSYAQRSLWLTWQLNPESNAYNMSGILNIKGKLNKKALQQSINALVTRHETLRTLFVLTDTGEAVQQIKQDVIISLPEYDLRQNLLSEIEINTLNLNDEFANRPFQLDQELPFRVSLLCLPDNSYQLAVSIHHIVADGWSLQIFIDELIALYTETVTGTNAELAELPIQFADFSIWQRSWLGAGEMDKQLAYWCDKLGGEHSELALPFDYARSTKTAAPSADHKFVLVADLTKAVKTFANQHNASLYMVMLALLKVTLYRLTGETDLRIGSPIANRTRAETHGLIGYLTNVQVLRTQLDVGAGFTALLAQVRETVLGGQANPDVPFDMLVETLKPERQSGVNPLFQVKCTQQNNEELNKIYEFADLTMQIEGIGSEESHFDLSFDFTDKGEEVAGFLNYNSSLFKAETIQRVAEMFISLAEQVTSASEQPIALLDLASCPSEKQGASLEFTDENVLALWNKSVANNAEQVAVQDQYAHLTFKALDNRANQLASQLQQQGISRGYCVAVIAERSCEFVLAILAVLKSGAMYLPLDPQQPRERLRYQIQDSQSAVILSTKEFDELADVPQITLDVNEVLDEHVDFIDKPIHPDQPVYMIYTSGTTGQPKGVVVTHSALNNYTQSILAELALPEAVKTMAMVSTVAADLGNTTLFGALCSGRALHMVSSEVAFDPDAFAEYMTAHHIDVLKIVPSHLQGLLSAAASENVLPKKLLIVGGEATSQALLTQISQLAPELEVLNHYGPTESTVGVLTNKLISQGKVVEAISLGLPIANTNARILGADLQTVPMGSVGELYLGGASLAQGYLGQVMQTAERFIADPEHSGARLYRTGDKVRQLSDGTFEFIGRVDEQVKIRGYRVELNEVKQHLLSLDNVSDAAVIVSEDEGRTQLHAYLVPVGSESLDTASIRQLISEQLPDYMVPTRLTALEALPLNANGKLDKKVLLALIKSNQISSLAQVDSQQVQGPKEIVLAEIWKKLLKIEQIGRHDNFFELGGDSILALQVVARARKKGLKFTPKVLMAKQTIAALATVIKAPKNSIEDSTEAQLTTIWRDVLKVENITSHDNFFELGGDSILALQVVARARKQGLKFSPKALMDKQTISELAKVTTQKSKKATEPVTQTLSQSPFALLPTQRWFFEQKFSEAEHWNQSVMLQAPQGCDFALVEQAAQLLIRRHPALAMCFEQIDGQWLQHYNTQNSDAAFALIDLTNAEHKSQAIKTSADKAQTSLNFKQPFKVIGFDLGQGASHLLLTGHHLVVDGVSWRIILEDLQSIYVTLSYGETVTVEQNLGFKSWSEQLSQQAKSGAFTQELDYWLGVVSASQVNLPGNAQGDNTLASCQSLSVELDSGQTQQLLSGVPKAYRTQINDVLLAALTPVLCHWSGRDDVLVELEGHGRETLFDDLDIGSSVGWFTSLYPVRLTTNEDIASLLRGVKETLRQVPNNGLGYGALKYLTTEGKVLSNSAYPKVTFNYLGQFDQVINTENEWRLSDEAKGIERALTSERRTWLDFNVIMFEGKLKISLNYSQAIHMQVQAQDLLDNYLVQLKSLITHCTSGAMGITPSDFPLVNIAQGELDQLALPLQTLTDLYPLSPMQSGMYFHSLYDDTGTSYVNQLQVDISGLDSIRFKSAWQAILNRHEILRTGFVTHDKQSLQWVAKTAELPCVEFDWREDQRIDVKLKELAASQLAEGFCLETPPLMKIALVRITDDTWHFIWTRHHLLLDGWSTSLLLGEVLRHYTGQTLPAVTSHYRDYISWLSSCDMKETEAFWSEQLAQLESPTFLANSFAKVSPKSEGETGYGKVRLTLDVEATVRLSDFAKKSHITLNTLVQGAWSLLLSRYASQTTIAFGATVAGRPTEIEGIEQQIGLFINTLPVIVDVSPEQKVGDWLRALQNKNFAAREYEYTPLTDIHRWAGHGSQGIFDSIVVFENYPVSETLKADSPGGLVFGDVEIKEETNYPLTLVVTGSDKLALEFNYDNAFYDEQSIERLSQHFSQVLTQFIEGKTQRLGEIEFVSDSEVKQLELWGVNETKYDNSVPVHQLIEQQVALTPNATALVFEEEQLTYTELNQRANQLAHYLIAQGVKPEDKVGIAVERSVEMVVSLLAVLKSGAAYVPLDPELPQARIEYIIKSSELKLLLSQSHLSANIKGGSDGVYLAMLDKLDIAGFSTENPKIKIKGEQLAYVIYTSGSTGKPKGVANTHGALYNRLAWMQEVYSLTPDDKVLQKTPFGFDVSVWEFFWPLMYGARLVVAPVSIHKDPEELIKTINQHQISTLHFVPSMMQAFIASESATSCTSLTRIVCSGEALPAPLQATTLKKLPQAQLYNLYGPTEAAIDVTHWTCDGNGDVPVPIGSPISATSTYVLDSGMNLVPQGAIGELYLGGIGLARGYLNRTDLTSAFFIANPFSKEGGRLYRTGDLVHWNNAGALEYQGRIDYQVKIRGFRVELGEIESALLKQVDVSEAVVVAKESQSSTRLVAYISPNTNTEVDTMELKAVLSQSLPDYMVPSIIVLLDALPLNLNGKIDRKALPEPEFVSNNEYQAPVGEVEVLLAKIWSEVLNVEKIGRHDNFFELGGDSITSLRLVSKINYQLNGQLSVRNIFEQQTLKEQALLVINDEKHTPPLLPKLKTVPRQQYMPLSLSQTSLWLADKLALSAHDKSAYNIAGGVELNGTLDKEKLNAAFKLVIARHEVFRMAFTEQEENPVVTLVSEIAFNMVQHDLSQLSVIDKIAVAQQVKRNFEAKPFDLTQAPLLRAELIVLSGEKVQLLVNMHHIISDGWSVSILVKELGVAYQSLLKNSLPSWPELAIQYVDFAIWQNSLLKSVAMSDSIKFWQQYLKEAPTCSALPVHIPRAEQQSSKGDSVSFTFDAPTTSALKQLALKHKVSLYTLLLSSYQLFLHALLDQGDIVVGTDMAGREQQELQALIGFFINVVPVRSIFDKEQSVAQVLKSCQENTLNVSANQMLPYEKILESANSKRQSTISPLIQQLFVMQNTPEMIWPVADIELNVLPAEINSSKFDSAMFLTLENDILKANWVYRSKLYKAVKMQQLAKYWQKLVEKIIQNDSVTNTQLINQFKKEIQTMEKTSRLSKFSKLKKGPVTKKVRSKVQVKSSFFSEDAIFPIMLQPNSPDLDPISWAESNRPFIENKLLTNGGIVFRDFGIKTPQEFEAFAEAILPGLHGAYGDLPKKEGGKNTYRSTPYPEKQMILYHNESAHLECWPRKQWFFCELPSVIGGATPIVDGREMLKRLPALLLEKFETKGLLYIRTFNKNLDVSWQHFYKTDSKQAIEKRLDDAGISYQWLDNDGLQTRTYCPAVITHPISGERSFFNQVQLHHSYCLEPDIRNDLLALVSEEFLPRNVHFGDGSKISDEEMRIVGESYEACAIRFDWKKGDVVMVDNMIVSHARDPFEGARKIVVAMGDIVTKTQLQAGTYISSVKAIKSEEVPA